MILDSKKMKIAFDVCPMIGSYKSGIGYCAYGFVKTMTNKYDNDYILNYIGKKQHKKSLVRLIGNKSKNISINRFGFKNSVYKVVSTFLPVPYSKLFKDSVDITHFFNYYLPPGVNGKKIVTVHDMAYKRFPEMVRFRTRKMLDLSLKKSIDRADLIITVSEFSRQEILSFFPECDGKIEVVCNGVDLDMFRPISDRVIIENVKKKYNIEGNFLLYLGTIEPRKNIERLLKAYYALKTRLVDCQRLVLAGGKGWLDSGIFSTLEKLNLKDDVIFTGYVSDEDVPILINASKVFLFPSIYEGFGMPPLEAMACGVPVLTSSVSSLPEVVGDTAVLVDPFSVESISSGMEKIVSNEKLRAQLSKKGKERAQLFSWEVVTDKLYEIYEDLVRR